MGITERREREKAQRRNDILDAAEKVFFARGLDNATMDEVAEEAELSKGTLYLYFKSKKELYLGINIRGFEILHQMFRDANASSEIGIERVFAIGRAYFQFYTDYPNYFNAMLYFEAIELDLTDNTSLDFQCHLMAEKTLDYVAAAIRAGIEDGSIRADLEPLRIAYLLWAQSTGVIQILVMKGEHITSIHGIDPAVLVEEYFDFTFNALRAKKDET